MIDFKTCIIKIIINYTEIFSLICDKRFVRSTALWLGRSTLYKWEVVGSYPTENSVFILLFLIWVRTLWADLPIVHTLDGM